MSNLRACVIAGTTAGIHLSCDYIRNDLSQSAAAASRQNATSHFLRTYLEKQSSFAQWRPEEERTS